LGNIFGDIFFKKTHLVTLLCGYTDENSGPKKVSSQQEGNNFVPSENL
jgi:hypothetical protein